MKRGISTIISAILFIVLVVALIPVLINFSRKGVESSFEKGSQVFETFSRCDEVKFFVEDAYCEDGRKGILFIKIKNEKNIDFKKGFGVRVFYGDDLSVLGTGSLLYDTILLAYESKDVGVARETAESLGPLGVEEEKYKSIKYVEVIPKIIAGDEIKFCEDKKQKIEVRDCEESTI